ncbi:MAG: nitroreductase [Marinilabiliales bacterium]|nr:MAG: nitroreductase [Marinilabiliales bacterium]
MEFYKLIENRESIRDYNPDIKLKEQLLTRILNAGRLAPSASNKQPWRFILVSSEAKLNEVKKCYQRDWFQDAPHILILVGDKSKSWKRSYDGFDSIETDLAIAMDHLILAAENEGVGTCWIIAYDYDVLASALDLKENEFIYCITPLGYQNSGFEKRKNKIRKDLSEIVEYI